MRLHFIKKNQSLLVIKSNLRDLKTASENIAERTRYA